MYQIIFAILLLAFSLTKLEAKELLIVGTNAEFPPFTFIEKGEIVGFDIDIASEVSRRLHTEMQIKDMPFDALIPELTLGQVHILAAGMSYTEERAKRALFTHPYLTDDPLVILSKERELTIDDLKGKTVVVNEGYTADLYLSKKPEIALVRLASPADAFLALKSGRADAFVTAKNTLDAFLSTQDGAEFYWKAIDNTAEDCSLVVSKKYPELLERIQKCLDEMAKDGTLQEIKAKWKLQ
jgi:polar amino acid transport system substrate-binding protein